MKASAADKKRLKTISLNNQIKLAEQQLLNRQLQVDRATLTLTNSIHRQLTSPASLGLAVGSGFIIGELTNVQTATSNDSTSAELESPLMTLMNFVSLLHTALPLVWMIKSFYFPDKEDD